MTPLAPAFYHRLGNNLHIYAHARSRAEQENRELRCPEWIGEKIFTLDGAQHARPDGSEEVLRGYFQSQADLIYSRADCRRWFKLKPEVDAMLKRFACNGPVAHLRRGDYISAGYPVLTELAVRTAASKCGLPSILIVSDDYPTKSDDFIGDLSMLPDFYRLMRAPILFRGNSTFSWWASTLGHGLVFSPRIDGLTGGVEHDNVPYESGNHCKCADGMTFVTDLHLRE